MVSGGDAPDGLGLLCNVVLYVMCMYCTQLVCTVLGHKTYVMKGWIVIHLDYSTYKDRINLSPDLRPCFRHLLSLLGKGLLEGRFQGRDEGKAKRGVRQRRRRGGCRMYGLGQEMVEGKLSVGRG